MNNLLYSYQHIPYHLNPVAFSVGSFKVDWYSLMYLVGFGVVYGLLKYRIKKGEGNSLEITKSKLSGYARSGEARQISNKIQSKNDKIQKEIQDTCLPSAEQRAGTARYKIQDTLLDLMLVVFAGLLIGGRLGYVLFYDLAYYVQNPISIISPYDPVTHQFIGIYGMSYHGALIGALSAGWIFVKIKKLNFWRWANFVAPAIPAGYFFGRIGNFLNGELYGRATDEFLGMYFPGDPYGLLRHPSALYEAFLEGLALFLILWILRNDQKYQVRLFLLYIIGYAVARIMAEFFREPDAQIGYLFGFLTLGQLLSFLMLIFGLLLILVSRKEKKVV